MFVGASGRVDRRRRWRVLGVAAGVSAVAVALAGCVSQAPELIETSSTAPPDGMATYTLPLDDYIISPFDLDLGNYAENLLVEKCMNARGYEWAVPKRDLDSLAPSVAQSASGRRIFNAAIAQAYGYHSPDWLPVDVVAAERALGAQVLPADKQAALDSCIHR